MIFVEDIQDRIKRDFPKKEIEAVETKLRVTVNAGLNVGGEQFVRSVLFIANGDKEMLEGILDDFDDPRDIVSEAETKSGKLGHWFAISFEEIEKLNGKNYSGEIFKKGKTGEEDGLSF